MAKDQDNENRSGSNRIRGKIYQDRKSMSLRVDTVVHGRLMQLCDELRTPANTYVNTLIESSLKKRGKKEDESELRFGAARFREKINQDRVNFSLRLDIKLHGRLMRLCEELNTSANMYINALIEADLKKRGK